MLEDKKVQALIEGIMMMHIGYLNSQATKHTEEEHRKMHQLCDFVMQLVIDLLNIDKEEAKVFVEQIKEKAAGTTKTRH